MTIFYPTGDWEWYKSGKKDRGIWNGKFKPMSSKEWFDYVAGIVREEIKGFDKILDAGCGEGLVMMTLNNMIIDNEIDGFDVWEKRVNIAEKLNPENIIFIASIDKLPMENNYYDCSYTVHVLEQCNDIKEKAIEELLRVTKKKLIFIEPIYEHGNMFQRWHMRRHKYLMGFIILLKKLEKEGRIKIIKMGKLHTYSNPLNPPYLIVVEKLR
ncbi:MAG: class I SAM-dependent methyltransferase [Bacteroidales bacterium]|jgi:ubiquinone/menaquinone biosynthesis C-methylase UbiE